MRSIKINFVSFSHCSICRFCVCSSDTQSCIISYETKQLSGKFYNSFQIKNIKFESPPDASLAENNSLLCHKPRDKDIVSCQRRRKGENTNSVIGDQCLIKTCSCGAPLCWLSSGQDDKIPILILLSTPVSFRFTRNVLQSTKKPSISPENSHVTGDLQNLTPSASLQSSTTTSQNTGIKETSTVRAGEGVVDNIPMVIWILVGSVLLVLAVTVLAVVMYRKQQSRTKTETESKADAADFDPNEVVIENAVYGL